jgi:lysozyme
VKPGQTITKKQSEALLAADLAGCEAAVGRLVTVPLSDQQFGTLVSFAFNAGIGAFTKSTLLKKLNKGDYMSVPSELMKWTKTHVDGKLVSSPGLVSRRSKESAYWASGANAPVVQQGAIPAPNPHPISPMEIVTGAGTIIGPAAGFANSTGWINIAFGVGIVIAVIVIAAIVIKRQFFAR